MEERPGDHGWVTEPVSAPSTTSTETFVVAPLNPTFRKHEENPMMNDLILKRLFENSSPRQLNQCRLVCKQWYNISLPMWLSVGPPLTISSVEMLSKFMKEVHGDHQYHGDQQGIITGVQLQQYPKLHLEPIQPIYSFDSDINPSFNSFLNLCCGRFLTHLTIRTAYMGMEIFRAVLLCAHTPNLQFLDLDVRSLGICVLNENGQIELPVPSSLHKNKNLKGFRIGRSASSTNGDACFDWKILFECYPNLKDLAIGYRYNRYAKESVESKIMRVIQAIVDVRGKDMEKLDLKALTWFFNENLAEPYQPELPNSFPDLLRQANLQLEEFRFGFSGRQKWDFVYRVLSTLCCAGTLTTLEMNGHRMLFEMYSPRNIFPQLKHLTLTESPVEDLKFMKELPNLTSLRLFYGHTKEHPREAKISLTSDIRINRMDNVTFPTLSEFCCNYNVYWRRVNDDFAVVQKWFPNLSRLELRLDNVSFRLVCQHWPNLEHLSVYGAQVGDKGIAGLKWEEDQIVYQQPNITNLKKLRSFAIEDLGRSSAQLRDGFFSHHSLFYGFLKLPKLERLVIQASEMDSEVKQLILDKIPFARVTIRNNNIRR